MQAKISKNVKVLGIVSFLNDASSDMVYPLIPIFLTSVLGASYTMVGLIEGVAETTSSLLKVFSGWLSDKLKKRKGLTVAGYALSMVAKPVLAFATSPWHVLLVRFTDRFGKGMRQAPRDALIAESTMPRHLGLAYGFHKAMDTLGATVGPLIAIALLPLLNNNFRTLFLLSFVASFFALITLITFVREKKDGIETHHFNRLTLRGIPRRHKIFLLAIAVFALGNFSDAFLFLRAQSVGIAATFVPILYALSNVFFAAFATQFGRLADKIGPLKIIMGGYLVFALTHAGFALIASPFTIWLLFPMFGIFSAMTESVQKTITVQTTDPDIKGTMLGLTHTTVGLVQLPASLIAGFLWERFSVQTPFLLSVVLSLIAFIILLTIKAESAAVATPPIMSSGK